MRGHKFLGLGALLLLGTAGCGNDDPAPGSTIVAMGGTGGDGGVAGNPLDLGLGAGKGGGGAGGIGGAGGGGGAAGSNAQGGALGMAGATNHAGASSGTGGSKAAGSCVRAPSSDSDCVEFDSDSPQAWSCTDRAAFSALDDMHGNKCINGNIVPGAAVSCCCPP